VVRQLGTFQKPELLQLAKIAKSSPESLSLRARERMAALLSPM
jgi:hypothetical protein